MLRARPTTTPRLEPQNGQHNTHDELADSTWMNTLTGFLIFAVVVLVVSVAAAFWSFVFM